MIKRTGHFKLTVQLDENGRMRATVCEPIPHQRRFQKEYAALAERVLSTLNHYGNSRLPTKDLPKGPPAPGEVDTRTDDELLDAANQKHAAMILGG